MSDTLRQIERQFRTDLCPKTTKYCRIPKHNGVLTTLYRHMIVYVVFL